MNTRVTPVGRGAESIIADKFKSRRSHRNPGESWNVFTRMYVNDKFYVYTYINITTLCICIITNVKIHSLRPFIVRTELLLLLFLLPPKFHEIRAEYSPARNLKFLSAKFPVFPDARIEAAFILQPSRGSRIRASMCPWYRARINALRLPTRISI